MAVYCPEKRGPALYLECMECEERYCEYTYLLVVGSRSFSNYELLKEKLDIALKLETKICIVSGGAKGADLLAKTYAREKGYLYYEFPADWNTYGKKAGIIRNEKMHEFISHFKKRACIAFWDGESRGTKSNFALAEKYKNKIAIISV